MKLTHQILDSAAMGGAVLDRETLETLRRKLPGNSFTAAEMVAALATTGHPAALTTTVYTAMLVYQALVVAGFLPDTGLVWKVARVGLRALDEPMSKYAETLGPDNVDQALLDARLSREVGPLGMLTFAKMVGQPKSPPDDVPMYAALVAKRVVTSPGKRDEILATIIAEIDAAQESDK